MASATSTCWEEENTTIRSGVARSLLSKRFQLDEHCLDAMGAKYSGIPDDILFGINRLYDDNDRLKRLIAALRA